MHAGQDHADYRRQALISYRISEDSLDHAGEDIWLDQVAAIVPVVEDRAVALERAGG
jgi:hypothetical protein